MTIEVRIRKFYKMADNDAEVEVVPAVSFLCPDGGPSSEDFFEKSAAALDKGADEMARSMDMRGVEMTDQEIKDYRASEGEDAE